MNLRDTDIVEPEDERPARRDGTCFYCAARIGIPHDIGCVIVSRTVVMKVEIDVVISVPRAWSVEDIEFRHGESSWCADNMLTDLGEWAEREDHPCACDALTATFEREATAEDHNRLPVLVEPRKSTLREGDG